MPVGMRRPGVLAAFAAADQPRQELPPRPVDRTKRRFVADDGAPAGGGDLPHVWPALVGPLLIFGRTANHHVLERPIDGQPHGRVFAGPLMVDALGLTLGQGGTADAIHVRFRVLAQVQRCDLRPLGQHVEFMPVGQRHDGKEFVDEVERHLFVKDIAHAGQEPPGRLLDRQWLQNLGLPECHFAGPFSEVSVAGGEAGVLGHAHRFQPGGHQGRVAKGAGRRHRIATGDGRPGVVGPFDLAVLSHHVILWRNAISNFSRADRLPAAWLQAWCARVRLAR